MLILSVLILWLAWCFNWSAFLCESNCGVIGGRCFVIARYLYSYSVVHTIPELCWCVAGMCSRGGWGCATGASRGTTCSSTPGPGTTVRVKTLIKMTPHVSTLVFFLSRHPSGGQENVFSFFYSRTQLPFTSCIFLLHFYKGVYSTNKIINLFNS